MHMIVNLMTLSAALQERNQRITDLEALVARLDQDNIGAHLLVQDRDERIAALEVAIDEQAEHVAALEQTLTDAEARLAEAEAKVTEWETSADALGPVGRPE